MPLPMPTNRQIVIFINVGNHTAEGLTNPVLLAAFDFVSFP